MENEKQATKPEASDPLGAAEILSELFKGSKEPGLDSLFANRNSDPLDELYRQAVEAANEWGWPAPSRAEFEKQYKQETAKLRRHDAM